MAKVIHRGPGYGNHTNLIRVTPVLMVEHNEGVGDEESPMRVVRSFFTEKGEFLARRDPFNPKHDLERKER